MATWREAQCAQAFVVFSRSCDFVWRPDMPYVLCVYVFGRHPLYIWYTGRTTWWWERPFCTNPVLVGQSMFTWIVQRYKLYDWTFLQLRMKRTEKLYLHQWTVAIVCKKIAFLITQGISADTEPIVVESRKMKESECRILDCTNARFGSAVANIGDIDLDGFQGMVTRSPRKFVWSRQIFPMLLWRVICSSVCRPTKTKTRSDTNVNTLYVCFHRSSCRCSLRRQWSSVYFPRVREGAPHAALPAHRSGGFVVRSASRFIRLLNIWWNRHG